MQKYVDAEYASLFLLLWSQYFEDSKFLEMGL